MWMVVPTLTSGFCISFCFTNGLWSPKATFISHQDCSHSSVTLRCRRRNRSIGLRCCFVPCFLFRDLQCPAGSLEVSEQPPLALLWDLSHYQSMCQLWQSFLQQLLHSLFIWLRFTCHMDLLANCPHFFCLLFHGPSWETAHRALIW